MDISTVVSAALNVTIALEQTTNLTTQPCTVCNCTNTTNPQTVEDHSLKVNGGFIAMAAGLSVIVPLICVLIIQLRRSKREERERARAARAAADAEAGEQPADDPPPTYEQLFGATAHPASGEAAHSREGSLDVLIETDQPGPHRHGRDAARDRDLHLQLPAPPSGQTSNGSVSLPEVPPDGGYVNQGFSSTSVSTISGSQVFDYPLSAPFSSLDRARSLSRSMDTLVTVDVVDAVDPGHSTTPPGISPNSSSSSAESTRDAPPPPLTPTAPPPPYQSPAAGRHQVQVSSVSSTSSGSSAIQQVLRRFPGMHISIQDIFSSFRGQQENENEGPPPSYEEALKILESAKLSTQHILGKIN